jgi:hypothetical protein
VAHSLGVCYCMRDAVPGTRNSACFQHHNPAGAVAEAVSIWMKDLERVLLSMFFTQTGRFAAMVEQSVDHIMQCQWPEGPVRVVEHWVPTSNVWNDQITKYSQPRLPREM